MREHKKRILYFPIFVVVVGGGPRYCFDLGRANASLAEFRSERALVDAHKSGAHHRPWALGPNMRNLTSNLEACQVLEK